MAKGPQFTRYILPILHVLREMGGSATAAEGHLENLVFEANKLEHIRPHRGGFARVID
jgi:hypothetical protein